MDLQKHSCHLNWKYICLIAQIHFRQEHFLCEDEACLTKKFVVFQSEAEMKVTD